MNGKKQMKMADNKKISTIPVSQHPSISRISISNIPISGIPISTHIFSLSYILLISTYIFLSLCILFFPTSVSAFTISKSTGNTIGLVGWWTFDKMTTGQVTDWSGQGNHGQMVSMSTSTAYTQGKIGQALRFDGVDDYIQINDTSSTRIAEAGDSFSLSWWMNAPGTQLANNRTIGTESTLGSQQGWAINLDPTNQTVSLSLHDGTNAYSTGGFSSSAYAINSWTHYVALVDRSNDTARLYVNGVQIDSDSISGAGSFEKNTGLQIGIIESITTRAYIGRLDDVRIYNRALSATEVMGLYNAGQTKIAKTQNTSLRNGLVGHWTFDGITTGTITDQSGNGNHGSKVGMSTSTAHVAGKIGQALNFDGVDDYVNAGSGADILGALTLSVWTKARVSETSDVIIGRGNAPTGSTATKQYILYYGGVGRPAFQVSNGTANVLVLGASGSTPDNVWSHIVGVYDGVENVYIYVNGVLSNSATSAGLGSLNTAPSPEGIGIGNRSTGGSSNYYDGMMDDVRIYNRALSANEVKQLYALGGDKMGVTATAGTNKTGLVGHWTFDGKDTSTGTIRDISGQGNHGQAVNIATSTFFAAGKIGQAGKFDGVNDYVNGGTASSLNITGAITLSAWVNTVTAVSHKTIIGRGDAAAVPSSEQYLLNFNADTQPKISISNGTTRLISTGAANSAPNGVWNHIVGTYNGIDTTRLYINGVQVDTDTSADFGSINSQADPFTIGASNGGVTGFLNASIDDVRVYNRALSANEVLQLYNSGR